MIIDSLGNAIENRIKAQLSSYFSVRVYQLASELSYFMIENYVGAGCAIIYRGSTENQECKVGEKVYDHTYDIFIYQIVWKNTGAVKGFGTAKNSLKKLLEEMRKKLDNYIFTTELAGKIISARINNYFGTKDFATSGEEAGYGASIGLQINYKEHEYE